ncbi:urea ABC transporter ATP-binding subunit UrtE [Paenibacillus psychroresistens]|uniref:Urea ABC transporter ATP-binding subunit UrtE n=1 Tax=Paenibacillus psychroresistens TaxID=1778678 RepID=A0A6B8RFA7_9BACL|nr:urea ABC transporter ATP-binding subunit UrtE [Paenibacillus psychroresistens]QGQ94829.1 urea ABC transporter ATP-binding subunit UrtE [Paenibacillus psychroresistens]
MLRIEHLQVGYGESMILRDVTMQIEPGQVVCLMGRNGVGKTTLMKSIMGLLKPKTGSIEYQDTIITNTPTDRRAKMGIGYVPQGRDIFSHLTVEENLLLGLEASVPRIKQLPDSIFTMFPVLKEMLKRRGGDLSGGQQQQLSIARALASKPKLLLLDEPMEGIQPSIVMEIEQVIENIKRTREVAILLVEQSLAFATTIADYYYVLDRGAIAAEGSAADLSEEQVKQHLTV